MRFRNLKPILIVLIAVAGISMAVWGIVVANLTIAVRHDLDLLHAALLRRPAEWDLAYIRQTTGRLRRDIEDLRRWTYPARPIAALLQDLPVYGPDLAAAGQLLDLTADIALAADEVLTAFEPLITASPNGWETQLARALADAPPHLENAAAALARAEVVRARIQSAELSLPVQEQLALWDHYRPAAKAGLALARLLPDLLGSGRAQTYLLLLQNQDELRATGGFIGGVGIITLADGKILEFHLSDSAAVDDFDHSAYPPPPEPLRRYMGLHIWAFRDANWSPDFPTSAQAALELYALGQKRHCDGVIAIDQTAVQRALAIVGEVRVPYIHQPITAENVVDIMRRDWSIAPGEAVGTEWKIRHKRLMGDLAIAILERLKNMRSSIELTDLVQAGLDMLDRRHILIYSRHPRLAARLENAGWDGRLRPGANDYLMIVDTNVGYNRVDPLISQKLHYRLDITALQNPFAWLSISYTNHSDGNQPCVQIPDPGTGDYTDFMHRCYWDYWRVYLPAGAILRQATPNYAPAESLLTGQADYAPPQVTSGENDTLLISGIFVLPAGQSHALDLVYSLPPHILEMPQPRQYVYHLYIQKQAGSRPIETTISIDYPQNWLMQSASLAPTGRSPGMVVFTDVLETDLSLNTVFISP